MALTLTVAGTPVDAVLTSLRVQKPANGVPQLFFEVDSVGATYRPAMDAEVVLTEGSTRRFGGWVDGPEESGLGGAPIGSDITTRVDARHYASIVDRTLVHGSYAAGTLKASLQQMLADTANPQPGLTLHASQANGPSLEARTYDYARTREVLDEWSTLTGWLWLVTDDNELRFVEPGTVSASFDLTDGDDNTEGDIVVKESRSDYWNRVVVRAGSITASAEDSSQITAHGLWAVRVDAPPETSQDAADALAAGYLAAALPILKQVRYTTPNTDIAPGQSQTITLVDRNVSATFLVTDVELYIQPGSAARLLANVTAVEGVVYKTGWREQARRLFGGGASVSAAGFTGGGSSTSRYAQMVGSELAVRAPGTWSPTPDWISVGGMAVEIDTVARGTTSASLVVRMRPLESGNTLTARLWDLTAGSACSGTSSVISYVDADGDGESDWQIETFAVTVTPGSHVYVLQVLPGLPDSDVQAIGHIL